MPRWLIEHQAAETEKYRQASKDSKPSPWRRAEVVDALKNECSRKCMYCESTIDHASYSAVEHIQPKRVFEDLVLEWSNLGLACNRCNTNKGDYWPGSEELRLLNPYVDTLDSHIEFRGPLTIAKLGSSRGRSTVGKLKLLDRLDLLESRMRRIQALENILLLWHESTEPDRKQLYADDVESAIALNQEYAGVLRAYARESGFPVR